MSLVLLDKIIYKIYEFKSYWKNFFFDRLILYTKLKNTLKDYGFIYRKATDYLIHKEDTKGLLILIRESYTKVFKLMKILIVLSKRRNLPFFEKYKKLVKEDNFKLNNTFLKWKKYTIDCFSRPYRTFFSFSKIVKVFSNNMMRNYLEFFKRIGEQTRGRASSTTRCGFRKWWRVAKS